MISKFTKLASLQHNDDELWHINKSNRPKTASQTKLTILVRYSIQLFFNLL